MSWVSFHHDSETLAAAAHEALRNGDRESARILFARAADTEARAFEYLGEDKPRTLGITAVSATALWYKARELEKAEQFAYQAAATKGVPTFAKEELRELLQAIWNEQAQKAAGISFSPGQVIVSVKGGSVVAGGAPLDLILEKVQTIQSIFYRTAEFLKSVPLRKRGPPSKELQERCRPWLFQSVPGSYQFAVAIQKPPQGELFATGEPEPEILTETFLSILRAAGEDPVGKLSAVVPAEDYRGTFLKLTRSLAPTGKSFSEMEIRGVADRTPIVLSPLTRKQMSDALPGNLSVAQHKTPDTEIKLSGTLRALHLDQDWLEVTVDGTHTRVTGVGEAIDDVIGPMVNHEVNVRVRRGPRSTLLFVDIEREE